MGKSCNLTSSALLTMKVVQVTGLEPGDFVHTFGDADPYLNHVEQALTQLSRPPRMEINPAIEDVFASPYRSASR